MPGLVGYYSESKDHSGFDLLTRMARALESNDSFKTNLYQESSLGLGIVTLGIVNSELQPVWNEDQTICVMMEGELYDYQQLKQDLIDHGHIFQQNNDVDLLLHLYEELGEVCAQKLYGSFVAVIWDKNSKKLLLISDHLGSYPQYYAKFSDSFIFGSGVRALLQFPGLQYNIDNNAITQYLSLGHVMDNRTFFNEIKLLPPASILIYQNNNVIIKKYWEMKYPDVYPLLSEDEYLNETIKLLRKAVSRQIKNQSSVGVMLSGGIDSRLLLALLAEQIPSQNIHTFTWGIPNCDDARYAKEVSSMLQSQHHFNELKSDYLLNFAEEGIRITDGFSNIVNIHAIANLIDHTRYTRVIYKGFFADALMGLYVNRLLLSNYENFELIDFLLNRDPEYYPIVYSLSELHNLLSNEFHKSIDLQETVVKSINFAFDNYCTGISANKINHFDLDQRQRRLTLNGIELVRNQSIVRIPFCDKDFVEFMVTLPPSMRYERHIEKQVIIKYFPHLSKIPLAGSQIPLRDCARKQFVDARKLVQGHLHQFGILKSPYLTPRPYSDYNGWFRGVLREWVENLLLSDRFMQRGYFKPDYVRNLVAEQMNGANNKVKIGALISFELWHRQFID